MEENGRIYRILSINPGSTSTKIGVFDGCKDIFQCTVRHPAEELEKFERILDQKEMRLELIISKLEQNGLSLETIDAFVGRGGILSPMKSGVYTINDLMIHDLWNGKASAHASALGGIFASELGKKYGKPSFIVDPVVVDERNEVAKISGIPDAPRTCVFHALNQKSVARHYASSVGKRYEECCLVVAHLGGGISVGAHEYGRVVDVNDAIDGEGPFSPERCGGIQADKLINMCFSGNYSQDQMLAYTSKAGGLLAHLGTTDCVKAEQLAASGDETAKIVLDAMAYNIGKEIGSMAAVLEGRAEAIILTGGLAYSKALTERISAMVGFIAPVKLYPGEDELRALAEGALRVLSCEETPKEYVR